MWFFGIDSVIILIISVFLLSLQKLFKTITIMNKITLFFVFMMMSAVAFTAVADGGRRGDVNQDGSVNITDAT